MAIRVQHGGGAAGSAAGQIMAQAGLANLQRQMQADMQTQRIEAQSEQAGFSRQQQSGLAMQQIAASRDAQMRDIDAKADIQRQSADDALKRVTLQAGLGQEMQDQEFDLEVKKMQEQAKVKASEVEWKFSQGTKNRIARNNEERQAISDAFDDGIIDEAQRDNLMVANTEKMAGFEPSAHPADENAPPSLEKQIKVIDGETWVPSSSGPRYIPFKTTKAGYEAEQEKASEKLQYDAQQAKFDARSKMLTDAVSAKFKDFSGGGEVPATSKQVSDMMAEYDKQIAEYEIRDAVQRQAASGGDMGGVDARNEAARVNAKQQWDEQHAAPGMGGAPAPQTKPWNAELEEKGIDVGGLKIPVKVTAEQAQLPPEQGAQLAMFDSLYKKYPKYDDVPAELRPAYMKLLEFAEQYYGGK